jgi:hypothetical protein
MNYFLVKKSFTLTLEDQLIEIPEGSTITLHPEGKYIIKHHSLIKEPFISREFAVENMKWIKQVDGLEWERANNLDLLIRFMKERRIDPLQAIEAISKQWPKLYQKSVTDDNYWIKNATFTQI